MDTDESRLDSLRFALAVAHASYGNAHKLTEDELSQMSDEERYADTMSEEELRRCISRWKKGDT